jgi:F420-0:gamma-glutamyl ligase
VLIYAFVLMGEARSQSFQCANNGVDDSNIKQHYLLPYSNWKLSGARLSTKKGMECEAQAKTDQGKPNDGFLQQQ